MDRGVFVPLPKEVKEAISMIASFSGLSDSEYIASLVIKDIQTLEERNIPLYKRVVKEVLGHATQSIVPIIGNILQQARQGGKT